MIEFTWDARKAKRNLREHSVSFPLAQAALESGLAVPLEEQYREEEWRTIVIAPLRGILLLHITFAFYPRSNDEDFHDELAGEETRIWTGTQGVIRIISARKATTDEQGQYFSARPQALG